MTNLANAFCNMLVVSNNDMDLREAGVDEFIPRMTSMSESGGNSHLIIFEDGSVFMRRKNSTASFSGLWELVSSLDKAEMCSLLAELKEAQNAAQAA
jgi:hypothetical protein